MFLIDDRNSSDSHERDLAGRIIVGAFIAKRLSWMRLRDRKIGSSATT
jgi:hypothetical protein